MKMKVSKCQTYPSKNGKMFFMFIMCFRTFPTLTLFFIEGFPKLFYDLLELNSHFKTCLFARAGFTAKILSLWFCT